MILDNNELEILKKVFRNKKKYSSEEIELYKKIVNHSFKDCKFKNEEISEILKMFNNCSFKSIQDYLLRIDKEITFLKIMRNDYRMERDYYRSR